MAEERRKKIMEILRQKSKAEVNVLSKELNVSEMTIRRDLIYLEEYGMVFRTHGGAIIPDILINEIPYKEKQLSNRDAKNRIAKKAFEYISDGKSVFLDAGTTCLALAQQLLFMKDITVITNDLKIALELYKNPNIKLICLGGRVQSDTGAMIGSYTEKFIESINIDIAFIGTSSIDKEFTMSTPTTEKAFFKKKVLQSSNKNIVLTDHSKFEKKSFNKICNLKNVDKLITDNGIQPYIVKELKKEDINFIIV